MTCEQGLLRLLWGGGPKLECYGTAHSCLQCYGTAGFFDVQGAANLGYTKRKALAAQSREIDMFG